MEPALSPASELVPAGAAEIERLWCQETILVLYGAEGRIGAIDLESKFTEAALGNLHIADYRNFAHGRHHWLAKRGTSSGVLALVAPGDRDFSERKVRLIHATFRPRGYSWKALTKRCRSRPYWQPFILLAGPVKRAVLIRAVPVFPNSVGGSTISHS